MSYTLSDAMRDLAPHLIRREARASTRLDDCTQNEEEPMSPTPNDYKEVSETELDDFCKPHGMVTPCESCIIERLSAGLAQALAEKDRAIAQLRSCAASLAACVQTLDKIDLMLTVPAAEYVPVIPEVWEVIKKARAALPAEAERLLRDGARLDWMEAQCPQEYKQSPEGWHFKLGRDMPGGTVRGVIDAAMQTAGKGDNV